MKRTALLLLVTVLAVAGCGRKQPASAEIPAAEATPDMSQYMPNLEIGQPVPALEAPDIAGNPVSLADFRGKYVLLDFWATWCRDCRADMPAMKSLYDTYGPKGLEFLGVSFDTDLQSLLDYGLENEIPWLVVCNQVAWKENPVSAAFDIHWIPTLMLIDPEGRLLEVCFTADEMKKALETRALKFD